MRRGTSREHFTYQKNVTSYESTTDDFLAAGAGVCQDFTHLMLGLLRLRQIPCRYVSGYLHMPPRGGRDRAEPRVGGVLLADRGLGAVRSDPQPRDRRATTWWWATAGTTTTCRPTRASTAATRTRPCAPRCAPRRSTPKDISALHEEMEQIDVPVYQEIPERRRDRLKLAAEEIAAQQQQEQ